jgi:hypothetical protein
MPDSSLTDLRLQLHAVTLTFFDDKFAAVAYRDADIA